MPKTLAAAIASALDAMIRCEQDNRADWVDRHRQTISALCQTLPSGSGWDLGTKLDFERSTPDRLIFFGSYHHMNEHGMYDGWTAHEIVVTASLAYGLTIRITGRDRNCIKEYLGEMFDEALSAQVPEPGEPREQAS